MAQLKQSIRNFGEALTEKTPEGNSVIELLQSFGTDLTGEEISTRGVSNILNEIATKYSGGGAGGKCDVVFDGAPFDVSDNISSADVCHFFYRLGEDAEWVELPYGTAEDGYITVVVDANIEDIQMKCSLDEQPASGAYIDMEFAADDSIFPPFVLGNADPTWTPAQFREFITTYFVNKSAETHIDTDGDSEVMNLPFTASSKPIIMITYGAYHSNIGH